MRDVSLCQGGAYTCQGSYTNASWLTCKRLPGNSARIIMSRMRMLKRLLGVLAVVTIFYGACAAGLYLAMMQPPERFGAIMSKVPMPAMMILPFRPLWMSARGGTLHEG